MAHIYERNHNRLNKLCDINALVCNNGHTKLESEGFMDLSIEFLGQDKDKGYVDIALTHYYEQNGDLVPDPDMQVRIRDHGMAEALTYQDSFGYKEVYVYNEDGSIKGLRKHHKKDLNNFLETWLVNLRKQGFYS